MLSNKRSQSSAGLNTSGLLHLDWLNCKHRLSWALEIIQNSSFYCLLVNACKAWRDWQQTWFKVKRFQFKVKKVHLCKLCLEVWAPDAPWGPQWLRCIWNCSSYEVISQRAARQDKYGLMLQTRPIRWNFENRELVRHVSFDLTWSNSEP